MVYLKLQLSMALKKKEKILKVNLKKENIFFVINAKKNALVKSQSHPQELEEGPGSRLYLPVIVIMRTLRTKVNQILLRVFLEILFTM